MISQTFEELYRPQTWYGLSGARVTGEQLARHLEAAARLMERDDWDPQVQAPYSGRYLYDALRLTAEHGEGDADTMFVARKVMETLLRIHTGAPFVAYEAWSEHRDRTLHDVLTLLRAAATVARETAPAAPPPGRPQLAASGNPSIGGER
jgi:hypothetical protein